MTKLIQAGHRWFRSLVRDGSGEVVGDTFCGGGITSKAIEKVIGRPVDFAVNHDHYAIEMHKKNNPGTDHFACDIREVNPRTVMPGRPIEFLWLSPDCTFFSKAKGGQPVTRGRRALANVTIVWMKARRPRVVMLENVEEFQDWGPLGADGRPDKSKKGQSFKVFISKMRRLGYEVEWRVLVAADYGAPTTRKRLFLIARCDGRPIVWPGATHAPADVAGAQGLLPWVPAWTCIDFSVPTYSIFLTKAQAKAQGLNIRRPLAPKTIERILEGARRYVVNDPQPFFVCLNHQGGFRGFGSDQPWPTLTASRDAAALVVPYLTKLYGTSAGGASAKRPMPTITSGGNHILFSFAFMVKYFGSAEHGQSLKDPLHTITGKPRFGLVQINGDQYEIKDICMRMPTVDELKRAQYGSYAKDYQLTGTVAQRTRSIGNSVQPDVAEALIRANYKLNEAPLEAAA